MNSYAFVFAALVIAVQGSSLRVVRQTGWGAPPPPPAAIEIDLTADAAAVGAGSADASQGILVVADGNGWVPAEVILAAGTSAVVEQDIDIDQIAVVDLPNQSSTSLNVVSVDNIAAANDAATILAVGGDAVSVAIVGADNASGSGLISADATTLNTQIA